MWYRKKRGPERVKVNCIPKLETEISGTSHVKSVKGPFKLVKEYMGDEEWVNLLIRLKPSVFAHRHGSYIIWLSTTRYTRVQECLFYIDLKFATAFDLYRRFLNRSNYRYDF